MSRSSANDDFNLDRIRRLVSDLEQELAKAPADSPELQGLREEVEAIKEVLNSQRSSQGWVADELHSIRASLKKMTATIEGEVLKDSPYIAEIGRILGMV